MTRPDPAALAADQAESRFRLRAGFATMLFVFLNFLGVAWDIQWHNDVGPDSFWTAPHLFFYGGTAFAGLLCLYVVLRTTIRYRRGAPGVTDATTTPWLGLFRAPMGFVITGLGSLTFLISGLYDQWWHGVWGFDVTLVSPPHIGLLFAGLINAIGAVYIFASESTRGANRGETGLLRPANIGLSLAMALMLAEASHFLLIGLSDIQYLGPVQTHSLLVTLLFGLVLLGSLAFLRRPGIATLIALWFTAIRLIALYGPVWATKVYAAAMNLPFREGTQKIALVALAMPALLIVPALLLDLVMVVALRLGWGRLVAPAAIVLAMGANYLLDNRLLAVNHVFARPANRAMADALVLSHTWPTLLAILIAGILIGWGGWNFGLTLRYTER